MSEVKYQDWYEYREKTVFLLKHDKEFAFIQIKT